jgi:hypothetical protein
MPSSATAACVSSIPMPPIIAPQVAVVGVSLDHRRQNW